ncbi:hypothetical protein ACIHCV_08095 [Streptomyces sp. NPDC051956]|uniref:hypothetical protein n=1 Tax=Streptomyces sp. NPDC051956 TaxID=3365677 RepID=UPI0037D2316A
MDLVAAVAGDALGSTLSPGATWWSFGGVASSQVVAGGSDSTVTASSEAVSSAG